MTLGMFLSLALIIICKVGVIVVDAWGWCTWWLLKTPARGAVIKGDEKKSHHCAPPGEH